MSQTARTDGTHKNWKNCSQTKVSHVNPKQGDVDSNTHAFLIVFLLLERLLFVSIKQGVYCYANP